MKSAMEEEFHIKDWLVQIMPPGPKFHLKGLGTYPLRLLVSGYIDHKFNGKPHALVPRFEKWTQGK